MYHLHGISNNIFTSMLLVHGIIILATVEARMRLTINGKNSTQLSTTSGKPLKILCTVEASGQNGPVAPADISIWRALNITGNLDTSFVPWTLVYRNINKKGYVPEPDRIREVKASRPSNSYLSTGIRIQVPLPDDSGVYYCNGSYGRRSTDQPVQEQSNQIYLSVAASSFTSTWMTVNERLMLPEQNVDATTFPLDLRCNSLVATDNVNIIRQQIWKMQNFAHNGYIIFATNWSLIYDTSWSSALPGYPLTVELEKRMISSSEMSSGFRMSAVSFSHAGVYKCSTIYSTRGSESRQDNSAEYLLNVQMTTHPMLELTFSSTQEGYYYTRRIKSDSDLNVGSLESAAVRCRVITYNSIGAVKLLLGDMDVTRSLFLYDRSTYKTSPTTSNMDVFSTATYYLVADTTFDLSEVCDDSKVSCAAWIPGRPLLRLDIKAKIISETCNKVSSRLYKNFKNAATRLQSSTNYIVIGIALKAAFSGFTNFINLYMVSNCGAC